MAAIAAVGCGGKGANDTISGTVKLKTGQDVSGEIKFVVGDKEAKGPILNGKYQVDNPPRGEANIVFIAPLGAGSKLQTPGGPTGQVKDSTTMGGAQQMTPPPPKYTQPNNGLKVNITGGKQEYNIELDPS